MDPLATPGELDIHLQREIEPVRAVQVLQLASGAVRAYCGWNISEASETLTAVGDGTIVASLPTLWLVDVTAVRIAGTLLDIDPLHWTWTRRGQLIRHVGWPSMGDIEVDCTHGHAEIPDVIKLVVLEQAARTIENPQSLLSATVGQVSRTYGTANQPRLSELDQRLLDRFRL